MCQHMKHGHMPARLSPAHSVEAVGRCFQHAAHWACRVRCRLAIRRFPLPTPRSLLAAPPAKPLNLLTLG